MRYKIITCIFAVVLLSSFLAPEKIDITLLEGKWTYKGYDFDEQADVYTKVEEIPHDKGGFQFEKNGELKVKQNSGCCGTPPIHYKMAEGNWEVVNDTVIHLEYPNWRKQISEDIQIISLSRSEMKFKRIRER